MQKDENTISASEINKFIYCNYQWYYEKAYGRAAIAKERKKFLESRKINNDPSLSNFRKGQKFHDAYYSKYKAARAFKIILTVLILCAVAAIVYFLNGQNF